MGCRLGTVLVAATLSQGCTVIFAGVGAASATDGAVTPPAYRACLAARPPASTRDCADVSTYPELRARPGRDARYGALVGLVIDVGLLTLLYVGFTSASTH
ncbi:MAG: hypothetical protein JNL83_18520 [Myxococcales bacterium]|nr:hypothetical protein [Myxococcales bacterium]